MYDLTGKVALVTGAGGRRGFGRAIANRLAKEGADVAVADKYTVPPRTADSAEGWKGIDSVVGEINGLGRQALAVICDISQSDQVASMVQKILDRFGKIDILVNNAGIHVRYPLESITDEQWNQHLAINLTGTFYCARAVAREMVKRKSRGKIINMGSLAGKRGVATDEAYCASKFGVIGLTQSLALDLAPHGINVNAVCPTIADTDIAEARFKAQAERQGISEREFKERLLRTRIADIPMGRVATTEDVANMVAFLASSQSDFITGQAVNVCGGSMVAH